MVDWTEEVLVLSEVHLGCRPGVPSTFTIVDEHNDSVAQEMEQMDAPGQVYIDDGGDLVLPRRPNYKQVARVQDRRITIYHNMETYLSDVGLQIWKGALLLADFIIHMQHKSLYFNDAIGLELGAGTGFVGIVLARSFRLVYVTDKGPDVLDNCYRNVIRNSHLLKHGESSVRVRELDWKDSWPPLHQARHGDTYGWNEVDKEALEGVQFFFAADVVYCNELTDAFFNVLKKLIPPGSSKALFLALEKRYNFSMDDLDVVANGYDHFRALFKVEAPIENACRSPTFEKQNREEDGFVGKKISMDKIDKYIKEYERDVHLELWEIRRGGTDFIYLSM